MPKTLTIEMVTGNTLKYAGSDSDVDQISSSLANARRGAGTLVELPEDDGQIAVLVVDHVAMWVVRKVAVVPDDFFDYARDHMR